jgi:TolA-binding protein
MDRGVEQPGVGISAEQSTGQVPKARSAPRSEVPITTRPMPTHEMKAVVRPGLPGWARLLVLLVVLGVTGIVALELFSDDEQVTSAEGHEATALDTLADVAAETARAERLLADIEQEREETRKKQRKASPRKSKHKSKAKSRKHAKAAKARAADFDDEDDDDDDEVESARSRALQHYKQGNEQLKQRAFASAVRAFHAALDADSSFAYAHRGLGVAYASMKQPKKAIQQYRLYLKKAPKAPDAPQVRKILEQAGAK